MTIDHLLDIIFVFTAKVKSFPQEENFVTILFRQSYVTKRHYVVHVHKYVLFGSHYKRISFRYTTNWKSQLKQLSNFE